MTDLMMSIDPPATATQNARVTIAHDWLCTYAGAERCVEEIVSVFPRARILTTVMDPSYIPAELRNARPSFLQLIPGATRHYPWLLPLMPMAWQRRKDVGEVDLVVSSSSACAIAVPVPQGVPHLCYCHYPLRYAWNFDGEKARLPGPLRPAASYWMSYLRRWDRARADGVTRFLAPSTMIANRIARYYGRHAAVVPPPVRTDLFTPGGERGEDFLFVGRLVPYKRADLAIQAFEGLPHRLIIAGGGTDERRLRAMAGPNVTFLGEIHDPARLRELYRSARALVHPAEEGFGINMAEAQACGTPVITLANGGGADIVEHGVTGWVLKHPEIRELRAAIELAAATALDPEDLRRSAERFSPEAFRRSIFEHASDLLSLHRRERLDPDAELGRVA